MMRHGCPPGTGCTPCPKQQCSAEDGLQHSLGYKPMLVQAGINMTLTLSAPAPSAAAFENLAAFSSEGPTADGRIKPDLLAVGTLLSAFNNPATGDTCSLQYACPVGSHVWGWGCEELRGQGSGLRF